MVQRKEAAIPHYLRFTLCEVAYYDVILTEENIRTK